MACYPGVVSRIAKKQEMVAKVFKNRRDIENGLLARGGRRIGKNRNGGESFQELGKEREWGVTQGRLVGSEKKGTVATVLYLSIIFIPRDLLTH